MFVDQKYGRLFLKLGNVAPVIQALPGLVEPVKWKGHNVAIEHSLETSRVLRKLGIHVPTPVRFNYEYPRPAHIKKPFAHQIETVDFLVTNRKCFVLNEMGTAKSACALWAADYLMREEMMESALIVAPLSTLKLVWLEEVFSFVMGRRAIILHGSKEERLARLAKRADFYIINFEGLEIISAELKKRKDIDLFIVDEAAKYRNGNTDVYNALVNTIPDIHDKSYRLWLMTGTPCPNAPTDAWSLARLVNRAKVPTYETHWKRKTMRKVSTYKWVPRKGSEHLVYDALQPAIRFAKKDCLDLPPVTYEQREVPVSKEQRDAFNMMRQHMVTFAAERQIDAKNAADKIGKLRQILLGAVKVPDTEEYVTLKHAGRLRVLLECIEQASAKVIVVVPFRGILRVLQKEVSEYYSSEYVNGDVSPKKRDDIFTRFRTTKDPHVVLCHPKVMAHGLKLTEADMLIFYGPIYGNEDSEQVMERFNRPGQTRKMTVMRLGAVPLEWEIYRRVEGQSATQKSVLDLYQSVLQAPPLGRTIGGSPAPTRRRSSNL